MSKIWYTYWIFYLKRQYQSYDYVPIEISGDMYAYTDNKKYAKEFMSTRDMNKFLIKKKKITRDMVNKLAYEEPLKYLKKYDGKTKDDNYNIVSFHFILTEIELNHIIGLCTKASTVDIFIHAWDNPYVFNTEYLHALNDIGYILIYNSLTDGQLSYLPKIEPDVLSCFILEFKSLLMEEESVEE